jgi:hypothetical protein
MFDRMFDGKFCDFCLPIADCWKSFANGQRQPIAQKRTAHTSPIAECWKAPLSPIADARIVTRWAWRGELVPVTCPVARSGLGVEPQKRSRATEAESVLLCLPAWYAA